MRNRIALAGLILGMALAGHVSHQSLLLVLLTCTAIYFGYRLQVEGTRSS